MNIFLVPQTPPVAITFFEVLFQKLWSSLGGMKFFLETHNGGCDIIGCVSKCSKIHLLPKVQIVAKYLPPPEGSRTTLAAWFHWPRMGKSEGLCEIFQLPFFFCQGRSKVWSILYFLFFTTTSLKLFYCSLSHTFLVITRATYSENFRFFVTRPTGISQNNATLLDHINTNPIIDLIIAIRILKVDVPDHSLVFLAHESSQTDSREERLLSLGAVWIVKI